MKTATTKKSPARKSPARKSPPGCQVRTADFLQRIQSVAPAAGSASDQKSLICLRARGGRLHVSASSPELSISAALDVSGKTSGLEAAVPVGAMLKLLGSCGEETSISVQGDHLVISSGKRIFRLDVSPAVAPDPAATSWQDFSRLPGDDLARYLGEAVTCSSPDSIRPVLHSIALGAENGHLLLVATDSYRLVRLPVPARSSRKGDPLLLPTPVAKALCRELRRTKPPVEVALSEDSSGRKIGFSYGDVIWSADAVPGQYPDYRKLVPEEGGSLVIDREEISGFLKAAEAIGRFSSKKTGGSEVVRIEAGRQIKASFERPGLGKLEEEMPGSGFSGDPGLVGLNPRYLKDMVSIIGGEQITATWQGGLKPLVFFDEEDRLYVLMPVRVT